MNSKSSLNFKAMPPNQFENFCVEVYRRDPFYKSIERLEISRDPSVSDFFFIYKMVMKALTG